MNAHALVNSHARVHARAYLYMYIYTRAHEYARTHARVHSHKLDVCLFRIMKSFATRNLSDSLTCDNDNSWKIRGHYFNLLSSLYK